MIAELRPNSAPKVERCTRNSSTASAEGRIPALPKRELRVSIPFTRKLTLVSRPPATESVESLRPVQLVAGEVPMPIGDRPGGNLRQLDEITAIQRQFHDRLVIQHLAHGRALGVQQGFRRGGDVHLLGDRAHLEFGVHTGALAEGDD